MSLTLGNWLFIGIIGIILSIGVFVIAYCIVDSATYSDHPLRISFIAVGIFLIIWVAGLALGLNWYNTSTASGVRAYKDFQSELNNGIDREITITAEDGRQIFHYEGKVDIESNHEDNYIKFEGEDGKRYMIYYGIQDTITIIEK